MRDSSVWLQDEARRVHVALVWLDKGPRAVTDLERVSTVKERVRAKLQTFGQLARDLSGVDRDRNRLGVERPEQRRDVFEVN